MDLAKTAERLRKLALELPETYEEQPWGDRVVKVRGKIFLFCGVHDQQLYISVKLPDTGREVLKNSWAKPTAYGLGKSGWVSAQFARDVPEEKIADWIEESYRALAPKKLVAQLHNAAPQQKHAAPQKKKSIKARVLLLCLDKLRAHRAVKALAERGVTVEVTDSATEVRKQMKKLDAAILDVGREQDAGLTLAGEIDQSDFEIHLFVVGIRDAKARKRAQTAATSADLFGEPPGDPAVVDKIVKTLA